MVLPFFFFFRDIKVVHLHHSLVTMLKSQNIKLDHVCDIMMKSMAVLYANSGSSLLHIWVRWVSTLILVECVQRMKKPHFKNRLHIFFNQQPFHCFHPAISCQGVLTLSEVRADFSTHTGVCCTHHLLV